MTERAPSARTAPPAHAPVPVTADDDDPSLIVRLHREVVDTPAPRRPMSPAQALHLANAGRNEPAPDQPGDGIEIDIVLPADTDHRPTS